MALRLKSLELKTGILQSPMAGCTDLAFRLVSRPRGMEFGFTEMVSAMVLMQMAYPGTPIYHSMMTGVMHPRTGEYLCAPSILYAV